MATKIRLQRHGRKKRPIYFIVVADSKTKRDGKIIEKLGRYEPLQTPAFVDINTDKVLHWLELGAETTNTVKSILSKSGILLKKHLKNGVKKGVISEKQAEEKLSSWLKENEHKIKNKEKSKLLKKVSPKAAKKDETDVKQEIVKDNKIGSSQAKEEIKEEKENASPVGKPDAKK